MAVLNLNPAIDKMVTSTRYTDEFKLTGVESLMAAPDTKEEMKRARDFLWNQRLAPYATTGIHDNIFPTSHIDYRTAQLPHTPKPQSAASKSKTPSGSKPPRTATGGLEVKKAFIMKQRARTAELEDKTYHGHYKKHADSQLHKDMIWNKANEPSTAKVDLMFYPIKNDPTAETARKESTELEATTFMPTQTTYSEWQTGHRGGRPASPIRHREAKLVKQHKTDLAAKPMSDHQKHVLATVQLASTTHAKEFRHFKNGPVLAMQQETAKRTRELLWHQKQAPYGTSEPVETQQQNATKTIYRCDFTQDNAIMATSKPDAIAFKNEFPAAAVRETASIGAATGFHHEHPVHKLQLPGQQAAIVYTTLHQNEFKENTAKRSVNDLTTDCAKAMRAEIAAEEEEIRLQGPEHAGDISGANLTQQQLLASGRAALSKSHYKRQYRPLDARQQKMAKGTNLISRQQTMASSPFASYHSTFVIGVDSEHRRNMKEFDASDRKMFRPNKVENPTSSAVMGPVMA